MIYSQIMQKNLDNGFVFLTSRDYIGESGNTGTAEENGSIKTKTCCRKKKRSDC